MLCNFVNTPNLYSTRNTINPEKKDPKIKQPSPKNFFLKKRLGLAGLLFFFMFIIYCLIQIDPLIQTWLLGLSQEYLFLMWLKFRKM